MKRLPDPIQKINAWVLGLDIHKYLTVWVLLNRKGHWTSEGQIQSHPGALESLYKDIIGRKNAHVAFEAGGSSLWAFDTCRTLVKDEAHIHVAHPKSIKAIANSKQKNDLNDAWWLAYLTFEMRLPEVWLPRDEYRELRTATRERTAFVRERTRTMKRIQAHMRQAGKALPQGALKNAGQRAALTASLPGLSKVLGIAIEQALEHIDVLTARVQVWDERIEELVAKWDDVTLLEKSIPGVGRLLAATIIAESGPIRRFYSAKAYARYTGLVPSERSSAGQTRFGGISREGNGNLRWALTQAVTACLRTKRGPGVAVGNWVRAREQRLGARKKAKAAAARKLSEAIWRLFKLGECFDIERMFGRVPLEARLGT